MLQLKSLKRERGFTLIELMLVIVIIGVLASVVTYYYQGALIRSRVKADIDQGKRLQEALNVYYVHKGTYPITISQLQADGFINGVTSAQKFNGNSVTVQDGATGLTGTPVFDIDLSTGTVRVYDVSTDPTTPAPIWP